MRFNRLTSLALCLGVVFLIMTGSAVAGTTSFNSGNALKYAREVGAVNQIYTLPSNAVARTMNVIRSTGQNFFVDAILDNGAKWNAGLDATDLTITGALGVTYTVSTIVATGASATFLVTVGGATESQYPVVAFNPALTTAASVKDGNNIVGTSGTINITLQTRDSATGVIIDAGTDQVPYITGANGVKLSGVTAGSATIDVASNRLKFVSGLTTDASALIKIDGAVSGVLDTTATQFNFASAANSLDFIITGDLSGITYIQLSGTTKAVSATDVSAGSVTLNVTSATWVNAADNAVTIKVTGSTTLQTRTLNVTINLKLASPNDGNNRNLTSNTTLTVWKLNGTVLVAQWVNGNNAALNSRVYIWNQSGVAGLVSVAAYTLPNSVDGSTLLGTVDFGSLPARSACNIKLAEDVLSKLGITLPYTDNGGNVLLEITIRASNVTGLSQTFSSAFAYGAYTLSIMP